MQITVKQLRQRPGTKDIWLTDGGVRGGGALWVRIGVGGSVGFYFRYTDSRGRKRTLALGAYDEEGRGGLTLAEARDKGKVISKIYSGGVLDLHEHFEREKRVEEQARAAAEEAALAAAADAQRGTLQHLLDAYVQHLRSGEQQSAKDVRSIFNNHVTKAAPDLVVMKAAHLGVDDFVGLVGRLVEKKKGRTADKLRSYLRAAYQLALDSKTNPAAPLKLREYGITVNPIASIGALSQFNKARQRVLSAQELGAYLRCLDPIRNEATRDALWLLVLLGGQRPVQFLRIAVGDVDLDAKTVTLRDRKGARTQPRLHVVPLVKEAEEILGRRIRAAGDRPLFSTHGKARLRHETLSEAVSEISKGLVKAGEAREFQLRDIRRTAETMLASMRVSSDIRAELQSHGLGGVQKRHYDFHDYALEKRAALNKWARHLTSLKAGTQATVHALKKPVQLPFR